MYPTTPQEFLTVAANALLGSIVTQWLKRFLGDWRYTPILTLVICIAISIIARLVTPNGPDSASFFAAVARGFWGATVATFGYEALQNVRGQLGFGQPHRKNKVRPANDN